jgi:hypothetical protein
MGKEFVQRRIDGANGHGTSVHREEDAFEVLALQRKQLGQRGLAIVDVVCENHLAHGTDLALTEEHVLGAAEADALSTEGHGVLTLIGLVGVRADLDLPRYRRPTS